MSPTDIDLFMISILVTILFKVTSHLGGSPQLSPSSIPQWMKRRQGWEPGAIFQVLNESKYFSEKTIFLAITKDICLKKGNLWETFMTGKYKDICGSNITQYRNVCTYRIDFHALTSDIVYSDIDLITSALGSSRHVCRFVCTNAGNNLNFVTIIFIPSSVVRLTAVRVRVS